MGNAKTYIRIALATLMLFLLYRSGFLQLEKIQSSLSNPLILTSGFVIFIFQFLMFTARWKLVTSLIEKISFSLALKLHLTGQFFNTFVPGGVGGDVVKAIELSAAIQQPKKNTLALTLLDRVVGLYSLILFSFVFLSVEMSQLSEGNIKYLVTSACLFVIAGLCILLRKTIRALFYKLTQNLKNGFIVNMRESLLYFFDYLDQLIANGKLKYFILISLIAQFLSIFFLYLVVNSLVEAPPPYILFFPLACFAFMAMAIPITPGGIGLGQAAFFFIFKSFGSPTAEAAIVGISLLQLFYIVLSLPGGYYFIKSTHKKDPVHNN
jgi:hypothetical protein